MIRLFETVITDDDRKAVADCLASGHVGVGDVVQRFEEELCRVLDKQYVICTNSGTSALLASVAALSYRDDVCVFPAYTHPAGANASRLLGRQVAFADIQSCEVPCIRVPANLAAPFPFGDSARSSTYVIWVNHNGTGNLTDSSKDAPPWKNVISDCSQALGCDNDGPAHAWTYSFSPHKLITTGQGGCVATNDHRIRDAVRRFINHQCLKRADGEWEDCGTNLRMSNIHAALGLSQLRRWNQILEHKRRIAGWYRSCGIECPDIPWCVTWKTRNRVTLCEKLREEGVDSDPLYFPVHKMPHLKCHDFVGWDEMFPNANRAASELLYLPTHLNVTREHVEHIARMLEKHDR